MARVAVTGSSGKLGRVVVDHLVDHGWDVIGLDRTPSPGVVSSVVDLTDFGQAVEALSAIDDRYDGVDALVHLAAIPAPGLRTNAATFANNMTASYNTYTAALRAGVRKIVWASSETVLGLPFDEPPPYVPVDEEYPPRPNSTYSLVKTLEEELARQLCRWHPDLAMTGLRFSNVMYPEDYEKFPGVRRRSTAAQMEPVGLHRRPRRRAGSTSCPRSRCSRRRRFHRREQRHRDVATQPGPPRRGIP